MSASTTSDIELTVTPNASVEVKKFMEAEGVAGDQGGLRVSVQPGGCSGFKYSLVIEDKNAEVAAKKKGPKPHPVTLPQP